MKNNAATKKGGFTFKELLEKYQKFEETFPRVDIHNLVGNKLFDHKPKTRKQMRLMHLLHLAKWLDLKPFRTNCMDPSFEGDQIVFKAGNEPARGLSPADWDEIWKGFCPEKNTRTCNELERAVCLGTVIKWLVDEAGWTVDAAFEAVCDNSVALGHFPGSKDAKFALECTGIRKVGPFYDLGNTLKIVKGNVLKLIMGYDLGGKFMLTGGCRYMCCETMSLADRVAIRNSQAKFTWATSMMAMDV